MKPSEFLRKHDMKEKAHTLDEWMNITCKELDKRFIDRERVLEIIDKLEEKEIIDGVEGWTSFNDEDWEELKKEIKN